MRWCVLLAVVMAAGPAYAGHKNKVSKRFERKVLVVVEPLLEDRDEGGPVLTVYDSLDAVVGTFVDLAGPDDAARVLWTRGSDTFLLSVGPTSWVHPKALRFTTADCTGPRYLEPGQLVGNAFFTPYAISLPGSTLYVAGGPAEELPVGSLMDPFGVCWVDNGYPTNMVPVLPVVDLDRFFTAPFSVR